MNPAPPRTLLLSDGGLASLVAAASLAEEVARSASGPGDPTPIHVRSSGLSGISAAFRNPAVQRHATVFGFHLTEDGDADTGSGGPAAMARSMNLLRACEFAGRLGCTRVLWPVQIPRRLSSQADTLRIADVLDRTLLVSRLATLDVADDLGEIHIETPYVDLADEQLADLARDFAVPHGTCWWAAEEASLTPQGRAEIDRWSDLLQLTATA